MVKLSIQTVMESEIPVFFITGDTDLIANIKFRCDTGWLIDQLDRDDQYKLRGSKFRGVGIDRLVQVLNTGIDVVPSDAPIFADRLDKAMEYGGVPKIILALDPTKLDKTFREVHASTDPGVIAEIKKTFPTEIKSDNGAMLWLTKLPFEDRRATRPYERDYAWWIPGNSKDALRAVLLFTDSAQAVIDVLSVFPAQSGEESNQGQGPKGPLGIARPVFYTNHSLHKDLAMDKTNQELWEEALGTAELLNALTPTLEPMQSALFDLSATLTKDKLPIDYISDAEILTSILLKLKARGAKIT